MSDTDIQDLEDLLLATDRRAAYQNQLEFLWSEFKTRTTISWAGHLLIADLNLLQWADWALKEHEERDVETAIILDQNQEPVLIEDIPAFHEMVHTTFHEALNDYYDRYTTLREAKTVSEIVGAV